MIDKLLADVVEWLTNSLMEGVMDIYTAVTSLPLNPLSSASWIPGISQLAPVFRFIACLLLVAGFYTQAAASVIAPITGKERSSPLNAAIRFVFSAVLVYLSYPLLDRLLEAADAVVSEPLAAFASQHSLSYSSLTTDPSGVLNEFWRMLLTGVLAYNIVMAALNQAARYLSIWVEYYMSPIAAAYSVSGTQADITKSFFLNYAMEILAIWVNDMLMRLALAKVNTLSGTFDLQGYVLAIALVSLASNSERIVSKFGTHILPTPDMARNFMTGMTTTMMLARETVSRGMGAVRLGADAVHTAGKAAGAVSGFMTSAPDAPGIHEHAVPGAEGSVFSRAFAAAGQNYRPKANADGTLRKPADTVDRKVLAAQLGASGTKNRGFTGAVRNTAGYLRTSRGVREGNAVLADAVSRYNAFVGGKGKTGGVLNNQEAAEALGLRRSMPSFHYDPGGTVSYDPKTCGIRMSGWEIDSRGHESSVTYAFGPSDTPPETGDGAKYSGERIQIGEPGENGMYAYRMCETSDMAPLFRETLQADPERAVSSTVDPAELASVIHPLQTMNGFRIESASVSAGGYLTMNGIREGKDGSVMPSTYLVAPSAEDIPFHEAVGDTGGIAERAHSFDLGNGYTAYPLHEGKHLSETQKAQWKAVQHPQDAGEGESAKKTSSGSGSGRSSSGKDPE